MLPESPPGEAKSEPERNRPVFLFQLPLSSCSAHYQGAASIFHVSNVATVMTLAAPDVSCCYQGDSANRCFRWAKFGVNEFYKKGCQGKSSASTGVEMFSRDPAHDN